MRIVSLFVLMGAWCATALGQALPKVSTGRAPAHAEFMVYTTRETAEARVKEKSLSCMPLTAKLKNSGQSWSTTLTVTTEMFEREIFLHIENAWPAFTLKVNDRVAAYGEDAKTPFECNLSPYLTRGQNEIAIDLAPAASAGVLETAFKPAAPAAPEVYVYWQPKVRIEDYSARATASGQTGRLQLDIVLANSYNYEENIQVGYDIYSPKGELVYFDKRSVTVPGNGRDTLRLNQEIPDAGANLWSPAKPNLYRMMLIVWREGVIVEYVPFKIGFSSGNFQANTAAVKAAIAGNKVIAYNVSGPEAKTKTELQALKTKGATMLRVSYPQPLFFYDLCDQLGLAVIDQADLNWTGDRTNRRVGGSPANDPRMTDVFLEREAYMLARVRNHACIVAWSLGGEMGNGYNMYRGYQLLKSLDSQRPVIYTDAQGEWNSDI